MSQIPNIITVLRILLIIPTGWLMLQNRYQEALVLMIVAGLSDALDGTLARRFAWTSRFGAVMDPVADKLLVVVLIVVFTIQGHLPLWLAAIVVGRDLLIMGGAGVYRLLFGDLDIAPTFLSKANTAVQIVLLCLVLASLVSLPILSEWSSVLVDPYGFWLLAALAVGSGADYVVTWSARAWRRAKGMQTE